MYGPARLFLAAALVALLLTASAAPASANWLTSLVREAGEAGGKAASHVPHPKLGPLSRAAELVRDLPLTAKGPALAAHSTPEGHWQFVNREGQTFTAGTPDELTRAVPALLPGLAASGGNGRLSLYLSEDSLFQSREYLPKLPKDADLHVVTESGAYALTRRESGYAAKVRADLALEMTERGAFDEALAVLSRPLKTADIRVLSLDPAGPKTLSGSPRYDASTKAPQVDAIDPAALGRALQSIRGQTAMIAGRVENGALYFGEQSISLTGLKRAAEDADVNLVLLQSDATRQPGGRNWLWQKITVGGLDDALKSSTYADFLETIAARRGAMTIGVREAGLGRVAIQAVPDAVERGMAGTAADYFGDAVGNVTGELLTKAVDLNVRDKASQDERDWRIISWLPAPVQLVYLACLFAGAIAFSTARGWFKRLWPAAAPALRPQSRLRRSLRAAPRELVFALLFLPAAGIPALTWQSIMQAWQVISAPFRWFAQLFRKAEV